MEQLKDYLIDLLVAAKVQQTNMANAECPRQTSYQLVCPNKLFGGCAIRRVEVFESIYEDFVERPDDCEGATCNADQSIQTCGKATPHEVEVRSICPSLRIGNCAVATTVTEEGILAEVEQFLHPECRGAVPPARTLYDRLGRRRPPRVDEYICGLETQDPPPDLKLL